MDDRTLVERVAGGDDVALRALFDRHAGWLAARLRAVLPAADVEDVLQETFVAVWTGAAQYRPVGPVGGWLWGIARRQAALFLRRRGPTRLALVEADGAAGGDPTEAALVRAEITRALAQVGPSGSADREVWRLMFEEDRPVAEVAEILGVPAGTVKSRAHRVRRVLRAALGGAPSHRSTW